MGAIITIASSKGGSGKTTLATLAAAGLTAKGYRIGIVDADPSQTLADWLAANYEGPSIESVAEADHIAVIDAAYAMAERVDAVIVDTAGFASLTAASAIGTADLALVPIMADRGSVRETLRTVRQIASLGTAARRKISYAVVRSQWNARGIAEQAASADLMAADLHTLETIIPSLAIARQVTFSGAIPTSGRMAQVIGSLADEIASSGLVKLPRKRNRKG